MCGAIFKGADSCCEMELMCSILYMLGINMLHPQPGQCIYWKCTQRNSHGGWSLKRGGKTWQPRAHDPGKPGARVARYLQRCGGSRVTWSPVAYPGAQCSTPNYSSAAEDKNRQLKVAWLISQVAVICTWSVAATHPPPCSGLWPRPPRSHPKLAALLKTRMLFHDYLLETH